MKNVVLNYRTGWLLMCLLLLCCSEQSTGPDVDPQLELRADAGVTEAWLALSAQYPPGAQLALLRDGQEIARFAAVADTLFSDSGLQPARQYGYQARLLHEGQSLAGAGATLTTLDTTSHQFSWRIDTLGTSSSVLNDVAIVSENDIWAVGEIHTPETDRRDSLGNWVPPYNAAHWNGQVWELKHIYVEYQNQPNWARLEGVFAFPDGNVVFSSGLPYLPEGNGWKLVHLWEMGILGPNDGGVGRIWGTGLSNLYFAGRKGTIVHYNGSIWRRLATGLELPIQDIHGARNPRTGEYEILCVAESYGNPGENKVLQIDDLSVRVLSTNGLTSASLWGVWFIPEQTYIAVGDGLWQAHSPAAAWCRRSDLPPLFKTAIDGNHINDIIVGGAFRLLAHFNGITWQTYYPVTQGSFTAVQMKGDLAIAVGGVGGQAMIAVGTRQEEKMITRERPPPGSKK